MGAGGIFLGLNLSLNFGKTMFKSCIILSTLCYSLLFGQYDYSLEDLNSSSEYFEQNVGASFFEGDITLHYFGHYN